MILWLDDSETRTAVAYERMTEEERNHTIWARTAAEAIEVIENYAEQLYRVSLDHDLGGTLYQDSRSENCGMEVVRFLERADMQLRDKMKNCQFIVHSWNIVAGRIMAERLRKAGYKAVHRPF